MLKVVPKKIYALVTVVPTVFLTVTVFTAGYLNVGMFFNRHDTLGNTNGTLSVILIVLVALILLDCGRSWLDLLKKDKPVGLAIPPKTGVRAGAVK